MIGSESGSGPWVEVGFWVEGEGLGSGFAEEAIASAD